MGGGLLLEPLDPDIEELFNAYEYCKLFSCNISEYEERPYKETMWMLQIHKTYQSAVRDASAN